MAVIQALRTAVGATGRNPVLFAVAAAFSLLQLPSFVAQSISPLLGSVLSLVTGLLLLVVAPFLFAGIIGMANEALSGRTGLETFVQSGREHYVSMLLAYLLLGGVSLLLFVGVMIVAAVVGGVAVAGMGGGLGASSSVFLGIVLLLVGLFCLYLLVVFFVQFYGHAIVVDGLGVVDGFKRSVACVRHNLLSVLGYSLLVGAVGAVFGLFGGVFSLLTSPRMPAPSAGMGGPGAPAPAPTPVPADVPTIGLVGTLALALVFLVVSALFGGFMAAYSTAFYRRIRPAA